MATPTDQRSTREAIIIMLLALATALKTTWALNSVGSVDVQLFYAFGHVLSENSLAWFYRSNPLFNHTPLTGCLVRLLYEATGGSTAPHSYDIFSMVLRMLGIFADIAVVLGMLYVRRVTGRPPWWALGIFALSPVSIIVTGFHGNIDPIMVMLLFFAGVAALRGKPLLCGVLFAGACNIKAMPLLLGPIFFFHWSARGWRPLCRFAVPAGALLLLGAAWPLVQCPRPFISHVLGYSSLWGTWGIPYWLRLTGAPDFQDIALDNFSGRETIIIQTLKAITIAAVLTLAWRRRNLTQDAVLTTLGAAFVFIFVFAPGVGPQYLIWCAPFLLLLAPRWWAVLTAGSAVFMFTFYHSAAHFHFPWNEASPMMTEYHWWAPWTNLPWGTFIALLVTQGASWFLLKKRDAAAPETMVAVPA